MRDLILIGQAPARRESGTGPLSGHAGKRLAALFGLPREEYEQIERINVLDSFPGKSGEGDSFPMAEVRTRARRITPHLAGRTVLFVGLAVADAFHHRASLLTWERHESFLAACIPHPSGLNRWWNSPENRVEAERFCAHTVEDSMT